MNPMDIYDSICVYEFIEDQAPNLIEDGFGTITDAQDHIEGLIQVSGPNEDYRIVIEIAYHPDEP